MPDLVAFLTARYDEEQAAAEAATPGAWLALDGGVQALDGGDEPEWPVSDTESERSREDRVHIAYWGPARVLADLAAKRARLAMWQEALDKRARATKLSRSDSGMMRRAADTLPAQANGFCEAVLKMVQLDASVYAEHPDYRREWAVA
jgi:hypothetical protein